MALVATATLPGCPVPGTQYLRAALAAAGHGFQVVMKIASTGIRTEIRDLPPHPIFRSNIFSC